MKRRTPLRSRSGLTRRAPKGRAGAATGPTRAVRETVLERDGGCIWCGSQRDLQVHHRKPRKSGGRRHDPAANSPVNLITLCAKDHAWVESDRWVAYDLGLLVREQDDPMDVPVAHHTFGFVYLMPDGSLAQPPTWEEAPQ